MSTGAANAGDLDGLMVGWADFALLTQGRPWFALLDACDSPWVPAIVAQAGPESAACLYDGAAADDYWDTAPYLARVDGALLVAIREKLWNEPWGWFLQADCDIAALKHHLRRFVFLKIESGSEVLFRFYDPRVVLDFLDAIDVVERATFLGPLRSIAVGWRGGGESIRIRLTTGPVVGARGSLVIRGPVLEALSESQWGRFVTAARKRLSGSDWDVTTLPEGVSMDVWIEAVARQAIAWGITDEEEVIRLLDAFLTVGWHDPVRLPEPVLALLGDPALPSEDKVEQIEDYVTFGSFGAEGGGDDG